MPNNVVIIGLILNLIASFLIAYGGILRSKKTIKKNLILKEDIIQRKKDIDLSRKSWHRPTKDISYY
jgi:hypothetical protein